MMGYSGTVVHGNGSRARNWHRDPRKSALYEHGTGVRFVLDSESQVCVGTQVDEERGERIVAAVSISDPVLTVTDDHLAAIDRVIAAMRAEPGASFTLDQFAEIASFSPYHFARLFRQVVGIPPGEFHAALRYEYAKRLLITTDFSITDICFEVGYDSLGTFSARFKQLVGLGPATFRALPDVLAELEAANQRCEPVLPPGLPIGVASSVSGYFANAHVLDGAWRAYVGLFPASIARNRPVAGTRIQPSEPFTILGAPRGTYRLLSALVPMTCSVVDRLLPSAAMRVAAAEAPIEVGERGMTPMVPLMIRALSPHDPPVLIALPALDFPTVNAASTIVRDAFAHLAPAMHADTRSAFVAR